MEKSKVENQKKIAEAEANAKVMAVQNAATTESAIKLKEFEIQRDFIQKWNGQLPSTFTGDSIHFLNIGR